MLRYLIAQRRASRDWRRFLFRRWFRCYHDVLHCSLETACWAADTLSRSR